VWSFVQEVPAIEQLGRSFLNCQRAACFSIRATGDRSEVILLFMHRSSGASASYSRFTQPSFSGRSSGSKRRSRGFDDAGVARKISSVADTRHGVGFALPGLFAPLSQKTYIGLHSLMSL
jgi:hypothetical protein